MEMLRETFFMKGFITAMVIAVLTKVIVWANYHRLLVSSEEMERPKRYWIGTLKKKIENYYNLQTKVNNISCIVDKYFEADKILGINSFFLEQIPGFCAIICVGLGCLGAIRGIAMNADINFWGRNLIIGVVCGIAIFMMDYLTKMDQMKRKIKINLINYLENILPNRMLNYTKKQNYKENLENKKKEEIKKEKKQVANIEEHWGEIASSRECQLTDEDLQILKDFIKDTHQDSTIQIYKTGGNVSQGIESWWFKRNEEHQQPEVSQKIDLSKYDAYYVDPKCTEKKIYLTFDCGYENGFTPKILDVLKRQKVVAAFFVTKPFIREEAKLVKRMKKEGHIVGNHTVHHKSMPTLSDRDNKQEIIDCAQYCKEATGYDMDPFIRPPMGEYNERTLALTKKMGYRTIFWSMAYVDFKVDQQPGKDYVIEHFQKYTHKGAIPLIHNISRSNAEALETVIINLKKDGYRFEGLKKLPDY